MVNQYLIHWSVKQPEWVQDGLRRHALARNFELDANGKTDVLKRVKRAAGIGDEDCAHEPFTADHLQGAGAVGPRTLLVSLGSVKNLARLAANQTLSFAIDGITLIYGDNGTGKSGYCRITKRLCRSLTTEELIGDVFSAGAKPPAEVQVRYLQDGDEKPIEETWKDGTPTPSALANISVFDTHNARLYVDSENKIGFLPREVALLEQFAHQCGEMDKEFDVEIKALNSRLKTPLPAGYAPGGGIAQLFQRLQPKGVLPTEEDIRQASIWTEKDQVELEALERALAEDPKALAERCRRAVAVLNSYLADLAVVEGQLTSEKLAALAVLFEQARSATAAAALAASDQFASEPLTGVGSPPWRLMYDYALEFIRSIDSKAETLPAEEGDACALCQQPLSADASSRMQHFASFIGDKASKAAKSAQLALREGMTGFQKLPIPKRRDAENALADYRKINEQAEKLAAHILDYLDRAEAWRAKIVGAAGAGELSEVGDLPATTSTIIPAEIASLEAAASEYEGAAASDSQKRVADRGRLSEHKDRKKLSADVETVLARLVDLQTLAKLNKCRELVSTKQVSIQITQLRRELVTADLEKRIAAEIDAFDLTHLPFRVSDRSASGQSFFAVGLQTPVGVANDRVLSEGEQRALALACFLGELGGDTAKHGLVIDDPVSSLDHGRIRRVALRIVEEAEKGRQVVLFTHNLLFYNEIAEAAAQASPPIPVARRLVTKSATDGFGIISDRDEPWIAQKVNDRIIRLRDRLKGIESRNDFETDAYRGAIKDFYTDLRETWERLVEEVLLGKVIERFNTDVKTQSLKGVIVEDEDYKKIYWAMKRASERSGHDMAVGRNLPLPKPGDLKADLKTIDDFRVAIDKRRKETEKRRQEYERPPQATTL